MTSKCARGCACACNSAVMESMHDTLGIEVYSALTSRLPIKSILLHLNERRVFKMSSVSFMWEGAVFTMGVSW